MDILKHCVIRDNNILWLSLSLIFIHKMHGFRGLNRDSFSGGWCSSMFMSFFWLEETTYGIIRHNFYTFGPLSYRRNDGIWSSSQIMYGLWPKFFHFVPTFHLIGTIHGIMTHWSDCVISHSSDNFVWSKSISQMLWKFKSLEVNSYQYKT